MTSVDDMIVAAIRDGDLGRIVADLDPLTCAPDVLRLLIGQDDPRLRRLGLVSLTERLAADRDEPTDRDEPADLAGYAESLPGALDGPPETALALARLHLRLRHHISRPWPPWRAADLPVTVRIAWLSAEIAARPETVRDEPEGDFLYQAVMGLAADDVDEPERLVRELSDRADPVLRKEALRITREAVRAALLAPARARVLVAGLADAPDDNTDALRELAKPWAALDPLPRDRLYRFLASGSAEAAVEVAASHGHGDLLRDIAADPARPPALRCRSLESLGGLATRDDIHDLLGIAAEDPLLLAGPAIRALSGLHRRGHFPSDGEVAAITGLALADHTVPAADVATILFTSRRAALRELTVTTTADPHWPRRLELLVALAAQGTGDLMVGETVTRLLPGAPEPVPFLKAIRDLRHTPAEEAVIGVLPQAPAMALDALEAVGGARTVTALREGLGLDGDDGIVAHLRPVRHQALELLWHLTDDPDQRRSILVRLDPRDLPKRIAADLGGQDEEELALLRAGLDPGKPGESLCRLARNGTSATIPAIADLLSRVVSDLAASWAADTLNGPGPEPVVPKTIVGEVRGLGSRLYLRGKIRPRCLLDAENAREAGDALLASLVLDLLDRPGQAPAEQMILLGLLLDAPYSRTRSRVHPLLRHRDRHVRKHAIALLARDAEGTGARALSASLIALTTAPDIQTVRQALLALGHVRAGWAAAAIAACLDHPNMNIKKTAASALARAGAPVAVPKLLFWLGHHDNPGLRDTIADALAAILCHEYAATIVAAADRADEERTRVLLLRRMHRYLSARAVGALVDQGSPAGITLLSLVAAEQIDLASGTVAELADRMAEHGLTPPSRYQPPPDADLNALTTREWNPETARRLVDGYEQDPDEPPSARLRPLLTHWLDLAEADPSERGRVLRFIVALCPGEWTDSELRTFARSVRTLIAGLPDIGDLHRGRLLELLEQTVPRLNMAEALEISEQIRNLPPAAAGTRSALALLRLCGAVRTRADLDRALAGAPLGPDPWLAEEGALREIFGLSSDVAPERAVVRKWRESLQAATNTPETLRRFRSADRSEVGDAPEDGDDRPVDSRDRLNALIGAFPTAIQPVRDDLLDWMNELQPLGAPPWTIAEDARRAAPEDRTPRPEDRTPRPEDLDQPRSGAQRTRLLEMLDDPDQRRRETASSALLDWPEPPIRLALLRAHLDGRIDLPHTSDLARTLTAIDEAELSALEDDASRKRVADLAAQLNPADLEPFIPLFLGWWEESEPDLRSSTENALRTASPDAVAEALTERLDAGAWGLLDLVAKRPLLRTPALAQTRRRLRAEGRDGLADSLVLVEGPLRHPDAARQDASTLSALRRKPAAAVQAQPPSREELFELARTGGLEQVRRALSLLAERYDDDRPRGNRAAARDHEFEELLAEALGRPEVRVRVHAHRISRKVLPRPDYLEQTFRLLDDPQPDLVRSAVKILSLASWEPAIPAMVGLLTHPQAPVRRAAADGLVAIGDPAVPALRHATARARPDKRGLYTPLLEKITATADLEPGHR